MHSKSNPVKVEGDHIQNNISNKEIEARILKSRKKPRNNKLQMKKLFLSLVECSKFSMFHFLKAASFFKGILELTCVAVAIIPPTVALTFRGCDSMDKPFLSKNWLSSYSNTPVITVTV